MINKDTLIEYVRIISGCDVDPNLTLVDFSLSEEKRNIVNLVNEEAKRDKGIANLLDDIKYSNNKIKVVEEYFTNRMDNESSNKYNNGSRISVDNYGFVNMNILMSVVGIVTVVLSLVVVFAAR